ncbi:MAG TPA: isoprenylcysteine carboxylmethyltransferase family protein [Longimicrobiales bacterium]|nr:isoprenylcysteine carboxylmethyltransferase family protein [Longimicrobiales bacterium]
MERSDLKRAVAARMLSGVVASGAIFFLTAGTFRYWEAWAFMVTLFTPMGFAFAYFLRHDPELLGRRLQATEERSQQRTLVAVASAAWLTEFVVPGLDHRFGWSSVPTAVVAVADVLVLLGYLLVLRVLAENSYAARTVRVETAQVLVTSGPYALVRHPMYAGITLMLLFAPLALGSYWALIPALATPVLLALRTLDEEKVLLQELPGYRAYMDATRNRIIPGVW